MKVQLITAVGGMVVATAAALDNGLGKDHAAMVRPQNATMPSSR